MIEANELKHLASGRWRDILSKVAGIPWDHLDGRGHICPKCGGADRFSLAYPLKGGCFCRGCFDKANGDGIAAVMWMKGVDFSEAIKRIAEHLDVSERKEPAAQVGTVEALADPATLHATYSAILAKMTLQSPNRKLGFPVQRDRRSADGWLSDYRH
jgi:phage/plasmid primase-like uncharacterized protein